MYFKNRFVIALWAALAVAGCRSERDNATPSPAQTGPVTAPTDATATFTAPQQEFLTLINALRAQPCPCGTTTYPAVPPLALNSQLNAAAQAHAADMAAANYFSHAGRDGSQTWDRMTRAGYAWQAAGENIAAGNATVRATFDQWRTSPGHCANMMSGDFKEIGVGYGYNAASTYRHYWVTDFGKR